MAYARVLICQPCQPTNSPSHLGAPPRPQLDQGGAAASGSRAVKGSSPVLMLLQALFVAIIAFVAGMYLSKIKMD